jgi:hypothetical protein
MNAVSNLTIGSQSTGPTPDKRHHSRAPHRPVAWGRHLKDSSASTDEKGMEDSPRPRPRWWWWSSWWFTAVAILLLVGCVVFAVWLIAQAIASNTN